MKVWGGFRRWFGVPTVLVFIIAYVPVVRHALAGDPGEVPATPRAAVVSSPLHFSQEEFAERIRLKSQRRQFVSGAARTRRNSVGIVPSASSGVLITGFEVDDGFVLGPIDAQAGWFAFFPGDPEGHIDDIHAALGAQHLRISFDPALLPPADTGAFSQDLGTLPTGASTTKVDIAISATGGADYFISGQSTSEGFLTWEVNFSFLGTIWVVDDLGSGLVFVDTGFTWTIGSYKTLTVLDDPVVGGTVYLYDDVLFYSQVTPLQGTRVEQVVLRSDNFHLIDDGDFDNLSVTSGIDCDDGIACTTDAFDAVTGCASTPVDAACEDSNVCTADSCNPVTGCLNDGTGIIIGCDDGDACTTEDSCQGDVAGTCQGTDTSAVDCDDGITCTTDTCDPATGCDNAPVNSSCDDSNVCTTDTCDTALGCLNDGTGITVACNDGNACTTGDVCQGDAVGTCQGTDSSAVDCDDGIACTMDTCDPATGCDNAPVNAACDDSNVCTTDTCDQALGCLNNGTGITVACDDGDACTTGDACQGDAAGTCAGTDTSAVDCDDGIACTTDTCDPTTGCANAPVNAACDDSNVCTTDTCDTVTGCDSDGTGITVNCEDNDACTTSDVCQGDGAGTCQGTDTSAVDCDDAIACTTDTCDPGTGCANPSVDAVCDDGNFCTADTCDTALGCLNDGTGIIVACNDGVSCTSGDTCQGDPGGTCQGTECILDLDGNGVMGTGDFALFVPCFGDCYPVGDPCVASNFDGDPNRCVGTSDFAAWVGCFGRTCGECTGCAGPGLRGGDGGVASATSSRALSISASVQVVVRRTLSDGDVALSLPRSTRSLTVGDEFYIEVWASRTDAGITYASGLASAFVDLMYDPVTLAVEDIMPSGRLGILSGGQLFAGGGLVSSLGGCVNLGQTALGADGTWVRVSTLATRGTATGTTRISVGPSDELHGVAVVGEFTNIAPGMIEFGHADVTVRGVRKPTNRLRGRR